MASGPALNDLAISDSRSRSRATSSSAASPTTMSMRLVLADGSVQWNVKRRVVRPDPRPLLNDPFAQGFAQRLVQQMSRRVVAHDLPPPLVIDRRGRLLPHTHLAGDHSPEVRERTL